MSNQYTVPAPAAAQEAPAPAPSHGRDHHTAGAGPAGPPPHPPIIGGPWLGVAAAPGGGPVPPPLHRNQFQQHMHPMGLPPVPPIGGGTQSHHHRHHHQQGRPSQQVAKSNKRSNNNTSNTASASSSASLPTFLVQTQGTKRKRDPALPKQRRKRYSREEKGRIMLVLYSNPTGLDGPPVRLSDVAQQFGLPEGYVFLL